MHDPEAEYPRITDVRHDSDGTIGIEDVSGDIASLLAEIYREVIALFEASKTGLPVSSQMPVGK